MHNYLPVPMRRRAAALFLCGFFGTSIAVPSRARAQWIIFHEDADLLVHQGIHALFDLNYPVADSLFGEVIERYLRHPAGYFFSAMIDWWHIAVDPDTTAFDNALAWKLHKTISVCDTILDSDDVDLVALFFKGGAIGYLGELDAYRERWVAAAEEGKRGLEILQRAQQLAPTNYDIMLGEGLYDYYAVKIPEEYPFVKPFMLFFPSGDKQLGLQFLRASAAKARYANYEAMYQLLRIYSTYENNPFQAIDIARQLHALFPDNVLFERYLGRTYVQLNNSVQWDSVWRDVLDKCRAGKSGYGISAEREARYYLGVSAMNMGRYDDALAHFYSCDSLSRSLDTDGPSGFMTLTNLKIGMIDDLQNKRQYALTQYDKVLSWTDYQNAHALANQYKTHPYGK